MPNGVSGFIWPVLRVYYCASTCVAVGTASRDYGRAPRFGMARRTGTLLVLPWIRSTLHDMYCPTRVEKSEGVVVWAWWCEWCCWCFLGVCIIGVWCVSFCLRRACCWRCLPCAVLLGVVHHLPVVSELLPHVRGKGARHGGVRLGDEPHADCPVPAKDLFRRWKAVPVDSAAPEPGCLGSCRIQVVG